MYLTLSQLSSRTPNARINTREQDSHRAFYTGKKCTVFLSHKHDDLAQLKQVANLLEQIDSWVYVDWLDPCLHTHVERLLIISRRKLNNMTSLFLSQLMVLLPPNGVIGN